MPDPTPNPDDLANQLAGKLKAALGMGGGNANDDDDDFGVGRVPRHRFSQVTQERNQLKQQLQELQQQFAAYQEATKGHLDGIKSQTAEELKRIASSHAEDINLVEMGIRDPLGRRAIREAWELEDKEKRGKAPSEWWRQNLELRNAHLQDPEKAPAPNIPRTLLGYLPEPSGGAESPKAAPKAPPGPPRDGGRKVATPTINDFDPNKGMADFMASLRKIG